MKFLFIAQRYHPNLYYQVKALINHGHKVEFFSLYQFSGEDYSIIKPKILGYSKFFVFFNKLLNPREKLTRNYFELKYGYPPLWKFIYEFFKFRPHILIIKNIESVYSLLALITGRIFGKKLVVILSIEKYRKKPISRSVDWVGKLFRAEVITPLLGDPKYENKNKNLHYLPFPHPAIDFKKTYFHDDRVNIICVGKFSERKEQLLLLKAVNQLKHDFALSLTLVGQKDESGYLNKLEWYIADNRLESLVEFKFDLPWREVYQEYKKHDLFVLPAYNELHSYAALEAMSCKLPVIVSNSNGIKWYVKEGKNGYIFQNKSLTDLIFKMKQLFNSKNKIIEMGNASFALVKEKYSLDNYNNNLFKIIDTFYDKKED